MIIKYTKSGSYRINDIKSEQDARRFFERTPFLKGLEELGLIGINSNCWDENVNGKIWSDSRFIDFVPEKSGEEGFVIKTSDIVWSGINSKAELYKFLEIENRVMGSGLIDKTGFSPYWLMTNPLNEYEQAFKIVKLQHEAERHLENYSCYEFFVRKSSQTISSKQLKPLINLLQRLEE